MPDEPAVLENLNELVQRARQGHVTVLPGLKQLLDARPELSQYFGDVGALARQEWVRLIAGEDLAIREATAREADDLVRELVGPQPTVVARLLAERVVICWLQVHHAGALSAQALSKSPSVASFWNKRESSAHRRYLQSLGALASFQRLIPSSSADVSCTGRREPPSASSQWDDARRPDTDLVLRVVGKPE
jgi:hypothetical protein